MSSSRNAAEWINHDLYKTIRYVPLGPQIVGKHTASIHPQQLRHLSFFGDCAHPINASSVIAAKTRTATAITSLLPLVILKSEAGHRHQILALASTNEKVVSLTVGFAVALERTMPGRPPAMVAYLRDKDIGRCLLRASRLPEGAIEYAAILDGVQQWQLRYETGRNQPLRRPSRLNSFDGAPGCLSVWSWMLRIAGVRPHALSQPGSWTTFTRLFNDFCREGGSKDLGTHKAFNDECIKLYHYVLQQADVIILEASVAASVDVVEAVEPHVLIFDERCSLLEFATLSGVEKYADCLKVID